MKDADAPYEAEFQVSKIQGPLARIVPSIRFFYKPYIRGSCGYGCKRQGEWGGIIIASGSFPFVKSGEPLSLWGMGGLKGGIVITVKGGNKPQRNSLEGLGGGLQPPFGQKGGGPNGGPGKRPGENPGGGYPPAKEGLARLKTPRGV